MKEEQVLNMYYEKSGKMEIIFSNVNIDKIIFVNAKNDLKFELIDSIKDSNKYCGTLVCSNIIVFSMMSDIESQDQFCSPFFVCDICVSSLKGDQIESKLKDLNYVYNNRYDISINDEYKFVRTEGGEVDISIICKKVEVIRAKI